MYPLLAALETASTDPVSWLVNYGVAGVVIALLVLGRLRTKAEVDGLKEQLAKSQAETLAERTANAALVAQITTHTLPQMGHLAEVLDRLPAPAAQTEAQLSAQVRDLTAMIARLDKRTEGA